MINPFNDRIKINTPYPAITSIGQIWLTIRKISIAVDKDGNELKTLVISPSSVSKCVDKMTKKQLNFIQFLN